MYFHDFPKMEINRLHIILISQWKLIVEIPEVMFPITFTIIYRYTCKYPCIMENFKCAKYKRSYFSGGGNNINNLITCKHKICIPRKIQRYVVNWYHPYIFHPGMYLTESLIFQHFYWTGIIIVVWK